MTEPEAGPYSRLQGARIVLRDKLFEDAEIDYRWRSDPELARLDAAIPLTMSFERYLNCLLYTSPSPRDATLSRMPSSA